MSSFRAPMVSAQTMRALRVSLNCTLTVARPGLRCSVPLAT